MKLYIVEKVAMPTHRESASNGVTCAHVPLFASSWRWLCVLVRPFIGGEWVREAFPDETPQREGVCDDTTGFILWGKERGKRWYKD